ncbi:YdcF family protein [Aristophania vespae]|uniref:YdcF family protein n=1 Tax=Aristophania vespae TaxID=2697033 RepID=UPI0023519827|nr:YdcF family protein [Aristophania vespae]UMM63533.1 hypothetical protein DM15PD_05070 [Aristophania vespae]
MNKALFYQHRFIWVFLGCIISLFLAGFVFFIICVTRTESFPHDIKTGDYDIVVFTGGDNRVKTALDLLKRNPSARLLISGVEPNSNLHQIFHSAQSTTFPPELVSHITLGYRAHSTSGNAQETAEWVKLKDKHNLVVVTSSYHMPRALLELKRTGTKLHFIPYWVQSRNLHTLYSPKVIKILCREYIKFLGAIVRNIFYNPNVTHRLSSS